MANYVTCVKITFHSRHNRPQQEVFVLLKDLKPILIRIADRSGIVKIGEECIDLTFVNKVLLEFTNEQIVF